MFIRWKKRKSRGNQHYHKWQEVRDITLSAFLVQSVRIDGKPRQKVIAFLHSIHQHDLDRTGWINQLTRSAFWGHVDPKLQKLALTTEQRAAYEQALSRVVPRLSENEKLEFQSERNRYRSALNS